MDILSALVMFVSSYLGQYSLPIPHIFWTDDPVIAEFKYDKDGAYGVTSCGIHQSTRQRACFIALNPCLKSKPEFAKRVALHELAHYVDYMSDGVMDGHKGQWAAIMIGWGQPPRAQSRIECKE